MKRMILAAALILSALPAYAGSITISVASGAPAFSGSRSFTIADSDMAKFYAFVRSAYPAPPCRPIAPATTCVTTPYTLAHSMDAWTRGLMNGTVANVLRHDKHMARESAVSRLAPIGVQ